MIKIRSISSITFLDNNPLKSTIQKINNKLLFLKSNKHIHNSLYTKLLAKNCKLGSFRILAKLHKDTFGVRPIINNKNHPTAKLCQLIDLILQPLVQNTETYIKDSQNLIQKLDNLNFPHENIFLYSMDFESLYTNIDKNVAIDIITDYVKQFLDLNLIDAYAFNEILKLIFENNVFRYNKSFFIQLIGLAMGCICGPVIANIFVYLLERKWLHIHRPIAYFRFIDDIFMLSLYILNEIDFKSYFLNLKLNIVCNKTVVFLDLSISFDPLIQKLKFSLYIKPTNTFSYLLTSSNHPDFIFDNIPKSLFVRIRRICSNYIDYLYFSRKLALQLRTRGYSFKNLCKTLYSVAYTDRQSLLPYKEKHVLNNKSKNNMDLRIGIEFNKNISSNKDLHIESFHTTSLNHKWLRNYNLTTYYCMSTNITSIFVHNKPVNTIKFNCTSKCLKDSCKICNFVCTDSYIILRNGFIIPIMNNCNCESRNCVYFLHCKLCNIYYIGQTKNAKCRMSQHIRAIKTFIPYLNLTSEVGHHFNLKGHKIETHFEFLIFKDKVDLLEDRLSIEKDLIHLFLNFHPPIINDKIPSLYNIKTLSFS